MASHLTTLIRRVKGIPSRMKGEAIFFNRLVNIAEYLHYEKEYSDFERRRALALLKVNNLDFLLEITDDKEFEKKIKTLEFYQKTGYSRTCIRCGRTLTVSDSIYKGYGPECYTKRENVKQGNLKKFFDLLEAQDDE